MKQNKAIRLLLIVISVSVFVSCSTENPVDPATSKITALYDRVPKLSDCDEGLLKESEKILAMDRLNFFRGVCAIPLVTYKHADDAYVQAAAEICASNNVLTHTPAASLLCYTGKGDTGCQVSNLWMGTVSNSVAADIVLPTSASIVDDWMMDKDVENLGHRRWLLNPFLKTIAFGRIDDQTTSTTVSTFSAIKVFETALGFAPFTSSTTGIGYPQGNFPKAAFDKDWYLSFSYLLDPSYYWNNQDVKFSAATVEMLGPGGAPVTVSSVKYDNNAFGLPNNIQWKVTGLQDGVTYTVKIHNIMNKLAVLPNYEYTFTLN